MNDVVSVMIADDQALLRGSFRLLLDTEDDMEVLGEAQTGREAIAQTSRLRPDVVLMDVRMPDINGIEATRQVCGESGSDTKVLILTTFDLDEYVYESLRAGASGFLLKDAPPSELLRAIRVVAAGEGLLAPSVTQRLIARFAKNTPPSTVISGLNELTPRECEVLTLIARGLSNSEISGHLYVSMPTVKTHIGHLLRKLHARDRAQLVISAYESGLVSVRAN